MCRNDASVITVQMNEKYNYEMKTALLSDHEYLLCEQFKDLLRGFTCNI